VEVVVLAYVGQANAALIDRGAGLVYDTDRDITWLQDGNYPFTSGYSTEHHGRMTWDASVSWATSLEYYDSERDKVWDDWRLPTPNLIGGYNQSDGEMGHLFYTELGNKGYVAPDGTMPQPGYGLSNTGPFVNMQPFWYWLGTQPSVQSDGYLVSMHIGTQGMHVKSDPYYAWAVRDGDVGVIPEPSMLIIWSLLGTLAIVGGRWRRKRAVLLR